MKKILFITFVLCFCLVHAQERFFLYGKILGADGMPLPSAHVSLSTVIGRQPIATAQAGPDGSFKMVVTDHALAMLTFSGAASDSFMLPLLLTTEQRTLNVTVRLAQLSGQSSVSSAQHASLQMQYGNTELGIAEKLMVSMLEEKRLAGKLFPALSDRKPGDPGAIDATGDSGIHFRDPDSVLALLAQQILAEQNPLHREAFLLRYMQMRTIAKRDGNPVIVRMVLGLVEPSSPFWSLVPELIKASASTPKEYTDYARRVKALTRDPELKLWLEQQR